MTDAALSQIDGVLSVEKIAPLTVVGDISVPQFRLAVRVRDPQDVAKYVRTAPTGVVVYCLWAASIRAAGGTPQ